MARQSTPICTAMRRRPAARLHHALAVRVPARGGEYAPALSPRRERQAVRMRKRQQNNNKTSASDFCVPARRRRPPWRLIAHLAARGTPARGSRAAGSPRGGARSQRAQRAPCAHTAASRAPRGQCPRRRPRPRVARARSYHRLGVVTMRRSWPRLASQPRLTKRRE